MYSTQNPIAKQSQQWLVTALLDLMDEKTYTSISVKEISKKADLDRSTFYRNFNSKEELLNYHLDILMQEYIDKLLQLKEFDMQNVFKVFLDFCNNNLNFIISLRKNGLSNLLLEAFNVRLSIIHKLFQNKFPYKVSKGNIEFVLAFNAGGMWNLLMKLIDNNSVKNFENLTEIYEEISHFNFFKD